MRLCKLRRGGTRRSLIETCRIKPSQRNGHATQVRWVDIHFCDLINLGIGMFDFRPSFQSGLPYDQFLTKHGNESDARRWKSVLAQVASIRLNASY